ncbi:hypothetical protein AAVH_03026 [Aphelenchoides avenae]|nr:hypothetical protein AAVH_03026 [Aphelenchus avenae]
MVEISPDGVVTAAATAVTFELSSGSTADVVSTATSPLALLASYVHVLNLMRFHTVLCLLEATAVSAIVCYDSQRAQPDRVTTCTDDQVCYAEYYAVKVGPAGKLFHRHAMPDAPTRLLQYYDRFCIHPQHCENRGLVDGQCLQLEDLDPLVRRTFRSKLKQQQLEPAQLVHTRFCCEFPLQL